MGLRLEWNRRGPPKYYNLRARPANAEAERVYREEVKQGEGKGMWKRVPPSFVRCISHGFVVPRADGRWRMVVDYKRLNRHLSPKKFKVESWAEVIPLLKQGSLLTRIDLKDAYYHIPLTRSAQRYLAFRVGSRLYVPAGMPFGVATAPRDFTRLLKPVVTELQDRKSVV